MATYIICFTKVDSKNLILTTLTLSSYSLFTIERLSGFILTLLSHKTNSDLYIHWNSFAPNKWKWVTIKALVYRAYDIRSTDQYLEIELKHMRSDFNKMNR